MNPIKKHRTALTYALAAVGFGLVPAAYGESHKDLPIAAPTSQKIEPPTTAVTAFTQVDFHSNAHGTTESWEERVELVEEHGQSGADKAMALSLDLAADEDVRALFSKSFGKEGLKIADLQPNLYTMFASGEYDRDTLEAALEAAAILQTGEESKSFAKNGCQDPGNANQCFGAVFRKRLHRHKPIFFFGSGFECYPITWSRANANTCARSLPADGHVPVYASATFRPAAQGGGSFSFWINYHVFYGWQVGLPGQAFGAAGGSGRHGNDWEMTSVHIVNDRPVAVRYRVHGSAVNTYPWGDTAMRWGDSHKVHPGNYFHGHYSDAFCHQDNLFGSRAKTWWDCRNPSNTAVPSKILACNFQASGQQGDGDSCTSMSRDLFSEPRWSRKDDRSQPYSSPPTPNFNVSADVNFQSGQLCFFSEAGQRGLADCIDRSAPWLGKMMNDVISSITYTTSQGQRWELWQHVNHSGDWRTADDFARAFNDQTSSIRARY